ncbi:hypothetical protein A3C09_01370 [Candidatus Uhrbacteria bacterium RIFCSPHIGHO2_02_FULL_47_44]|uniref:Uncharacterized protein n=1 Tax=Candidatus Uhrbacteria bacterium RIFCSPLOWO2_02_FULL_48_18 TaxID=1802408 RepID=A0A1F7V8Y7_9BACT|nr:MAG: hypothetical protein A3C09_01370 [Candidatus Uhrbacteria bacterium RIFCSPHIGHO2_02_FULL_47_44]OGL77435.1 MAG: hypothetical protein A3E97_00420 [Candidatus Uhrbacteria bacterium RIFCSPHIGHO2_12_FULL_47_12]OGL81797.1 MAG: hypothetical protein A3B20_01735 [Candidatus Uhrbacteria bacterium RIFCSPLOWO2_01_FULL_47_17]OGL86960.1 MAG: hypothetical protein A3I41_03325 [Candidatus Uhrbacteria bacterium RIFCSPLOWO2_02_FULL_48_18]OGL94359.1 MAG: hypothetical protein A3H12_05175 [Candidatus Uhrbacte
MARRNLTIKKSSESFLVPLLFGLIVASFFVVFARAPERVVAASSDRMVSVEGVSHEATSVQILRLTNVEQSIPLMRGPVYEFVLQDGGVLNPSVIQYRIPKDLRSAPSHLLTLIAFDARSLSWKPISTTIDEKNEVAQTNVPIEQTLMVGLGTKF